MTTTGLITIDEAERGKFLALRPDSGLAAAQAENGEEFGLGTLTRVKTPSGGATTWEVDDGLGNVESVREITGALVLYRKRATLWGRNDTVSEGVKPYLVSDDHPTLATGYLVPGGEPGDLDLDLIDVCRIEGTDEIDVRDKAHGGDFHYAEYGTSGKAGSKGKRWKEQRILGILRPGDMFPLILVAQPGSLKAISSVVARLTNPFWRHVVKLTLKKEQASTGEPYSMLQMAVVGLLPEDDALRLKSQYTDPLNAAFAQRMGGTMIGEGE